VINLTTDPMRELLEPPVSVGKDILKDKVLTLLKRDFLRGASDQDLEISFDTPEGDDILVKKVDQENALGYRTFDSQESYFGQISAELYRPTPEELGFGDST
jgi:hypothetical protein